MGKCRSALAVGVSFILMRFMEHHVVKCNIWIVALCFVFFGVEAKVLKKILIG